MGSSQSNNTGGDSAFTATGRRKKSIILDRQKEFPARLRSAIKEANNKRNSRNPKIFLTHVQDAFADWLFEVALNKNDQAGLNDERDTEQEVELALRFFPTVLCLRRYGYFPIFWLSKSVSSVSFIPLFAQLGQEFGLFQEVERGGLVFGANGMDVFSQLAATCAEDASCKRSDQEQQRVVDKQFLTVIKKLRKRTLMKRSDIRKYKMIDIICNQSVFPERRFRYLIDWDPKSLLSKDKTLSIRLIEKFFDKDDISGLQMLFELSMKHYPAELGFIFDTIYSVVDDEAKPNSFRKPGSFTKKKKRSSYKKDNSKREITSLFENATSLYQVACETYGKEEVQAIIDGYIYTEMKKDANFTRKALTRAASSCEPAEDGADAMYLLLQRDPSLLHRNFSMAVH